MVTRELGEQGRFELDNTPLDELERRMVEAERGEVGPA